MASAAASPYEKPDLRGKVCLVTGATKGIGRGIALQLGLAGAKVYVTGRTESKLAEVAAEIAKRGGEGVGVRVDHEDDGQVKMLFRRVEKENNGRLDVLVNNAYSAVDHIFSGYNKAKFYESDDPAAEWDVHNRVGLRNHYLCTAYGGRLMSAAGNGGLVVNVSSPGGKIYQFNPAYGVGKCALDRMSADCAVDLVAAGVAVVSLWPGAVKTEYVVDEIMDSKKGPQLKEMFQSADPESTEFSGMAVAHLAADPKVLEDKTGKVLVTADVAKEYGYTDLDGKVHELPTWLRPPPQNSESLF